MLETVQQFTGEGSGTDEDDILFTLAWHPFRDKVDSGEMGIINRQAVVAFDGNTCDLTICGMPMEEKEQTKE